MRPAAAFLALSLFTAAPAAGQGNAPAPAAEAEPANPYQELFTSWDGVNREAMDTEAAAPQAAPEPESNAIPAWSPLQRRTQAEAVALGERVGQVVRAGDCAEGERIAREAGDFALVRAVVEHCDRPR